MSKELTARKAAQLAALDAKASVARETDAAILTPKYTVSALHQNGWMRSYGAPRAYRAAFTNAYVLAWAARYDALRGTTICAWCPDFVPDTSPNQTVSHGICLTCSERMLAES